MKTTKRKLALVGGAAFLTIAGAAWSFDAASAAAYDPVSVKEEAEQPDKAKPDGEKVEEGGYASAQEVFDSFNELRGKIKNLRNPTPEEVKTFYTNAFGRIAAYLKANPEAKDCKPLYEYAEPRSDNGYGHEGFILLARKFVKDDPKSEDAEGWKFNGLFAALGHKDYAAEAESELNTLSASAKENPGLRMNIANVRLRIAEKAEDKDAKAAIIKMLRDDKGIAESEDLTVSRRLRAYPKTPYDYKQFRRSFTE